VIRGYAEYLLASDDVDAETVHDVAKVMLESADRVIDLVDTLIDVGRIEQVAASEVRPSESVDLAQLARAATSATRGAGERKKVELVVDLPPEPLWVRGDGALLHQMLRKLLDNAVKYSPASSRVLVRGRRGERDHRIEVEDQGQGIAPEHHDRIFEKFYMVDGGLARRAGGTGVGLYLAREIARLHEGAIEVSSQPGAGSCFTVRLPPGDVERVGAAERP
jgi:signal transduction histidine kinase